jgi:hypothetical protein
LYQGVFGLAIAHRTIRFPGPKLVMSRDRYLRSGRLPKICISMKLTTTRGFGKMNFDQMFQTKLAIAIISEKRLMTRAQSDVVIAT